MRSLYYLVLSSVTVALSQLASAQLCVPGKFAASDASPDQSFGASIDASGNLAVVGAPYDDSLATNAGAAYVLAYVSGSWVELQKLTAFDAGEDDRFGTAVSIDADRIVVGAYLDDDAGTSSGSAYVFEREAGGWVLRNKLVAADAEAGDYFGWSVGISGDDIVVGAYREDDGGGDAGAAYAFERTATTWVEAQKLTALDAAAGDWFGYSVDVSGSFVVVGAESDDDQGTNSGSAYVFESSTFGWLLFDKVTPAGGGQGWRFGRSVRMGGSSLLVGSGGSSTIPIHYFEASPTSLIQADTFASGSNFGFAGDRCLVGGAPTRAFELVGSTWTEVEELLPADWYGAQSFGSSVAVGSVDLVAAASDDEAASNAGAVYSFAGPSPVTPYCHCGSGPCGNSDSDAGCENFTGVGARLIACGSTSISSDDLVLRVTNLVPNQSGIVYMGAAPISATTFGDGHRCVGGAPLYRFPVRFSGPQGIFGEGPGIVAFSQANFPPAGHIAAGDTWYFQGWYRDPLGQCGNGFNLSNAAAVTFAP